MTQKIAFGAPTTHSSLIARFAAETGFFRGQDIDLEVRTVFGGPELASAYDSGAIRIGEMGSPPAVTAIAKGLRMRIVGSSMRRGLALFFVTQPDIREFAQLKGRRLGALSIGSCSDWFLRELLAQNGVDPLQDVHIEGLGENHARVLDLFERGEIAGALLSGLNTAIGEARGVLRNWGPVADWADVPQVQWSVYVANAAYAHEQAPQLRAILRTLRQAGQLAESDPQLWIDFTASKFGIDRPLARKVYEMERPYLHFGGQLDMPGLERMVEIQRRLGALGQGHAAGDMVLPAPL